MPWFKVDDGFAFHRKVITAGNKAVGLWVRAGSWSAHQLTDGHVPNDVIAALGGTWEDADRLVGVELWDAVEDGFQFRGWHDYQPSRESVIEERERARKRKQAWRDARTNTDSPPDRPGGSPNGTDAGTQSGTDAGTDSVGSASPTRPDPIPLKDMSEVADAPSDDEPEEIREDVERVCQHLVDVMVANGCRRPTISKKWRTEARLMIDKDGREPDKIIRAIDWAWGDSFWKGKIESTPKLRVQYDKLRLQAQTNKSNVHVADFGTPDPKRTYAADDVRGRWES